MSQDQQKPPEPEKKPSPTPTPKPTNQSGNVLQKVFQTLEETWVKVQPVLKTQSAKLWQSTTQLLEATVKKLNSSTQSPPPTDKPSSAKTTPPETPTPTKSSTVTPTPTVQQPASLPKPAPQKPSLWEQVRLIIVQIPVWWKAALTKIRPLLPTAVNQKLRSDNALTGAIAAVFILLFWITSALSPGKPSEVAKVPSGSSTAPPIAINPNVKVPPELKAPKASKSVEIEPPATPVLTPEQTLIASIQKQVGEITKQYTNGLIQSIQVNFQGNLLTVQVSDDWYNFEPSQQDKIATEMWGQAKDFDFSKLEITDTQGTLLARTPVVGQNMVILQRKVLHS